MDKLERVINELTAFRYWLICGKLFKLNVKTIDKAINLLKEQQPKKGHWKENDDRNFQCSECGNESYLTFDDVFVYGMKLEKFCSNCGADMRKDGEQE